MPARSQPHVKTGIADLFSDRQPSEPAGPILIRLEGAALTLRFCAEPATRPLGRVVVLDCYAPWLEA